MIQDLYFIYLIHSHIWINICMDDEKVAIIHRNIYPNMAINQIYEIQIFNHPSIFLAQHLKPNIEIWGVRGGGESYFFPSLLMIKNLQIHLISKFINF